MIVSAYACVRFSDMFLCMHCSCIGYWKDNKVQTIKVDNHATMASCVAFTDRGQLFGQKAKSDVSAFPKLSCLLLAVSQLSSYFDGEVSCSLLGGIRAMLILPVSTACAALHHGRGARVRLKAHARRHIPGPGQDAARRDEA